MMKRLALVMLAALMLTVACVPSMGSGACAAERFRTMYVYTENGGSLNVREAPDGAARILTRLPYGTPVSVVGRVGQTGWTEIVYGTGAYDYAYVQSRFLVSRMPGPQPDPDPTPAGTDTLRDVNAEFRTANFVRLPYYVIARPERASGWVNLRWAPSMDAERMATCPDGKRLTVLAELRNWYQVEDPVTGMIGFISRNYVEIE